LNWKNIAIFAFLAFFVPMLVMCLVGRTISPAYPVIPELGIWTSDIGDAFLVYLPIGVVGAYLTRKTPSYTEPIVGGFLGTLFYPIEQLMWIDQAIGAILLKTFALLIGVAIVYKLLEKGYIR